MRSKNDFHAKRKLHAKAIAYTIAELQAIGPSDVVHLPRATNQSGPDLRAGFVTCSVKVSTLAKLSHRIEGKREYKYAYEQYTWSLGNRKRFEPEYFALVAWKKNAPVALFWIPSSALRGMRSVTILDSTLDTNAFAKYRLK